MDREDIFHIFLAVLIGSTGVYLDAIRPSVDLADIHFDWGRFLIGAIAGWAFIQAVEMVRFLSFFLKLFEDDDEKAEKLGQQTFDRIR